MRRAVALGGDVRPARGAVPLLTSARCTHQAYRIGTSVWGVQFHPEVLAGDIATWGTSDTGPLQALGLDPDAVVGHVAREEQRLRTLWGGLGRAVGHRRERAPPASGRAE